MKLILNISDVPEGTTVTKPKGTSEFIVQDSIKVYGESPQTINTEGVRFLVPKELNNKLSINAVPWHYEVAVSGNPVELKEILNHILEKKAEFYYA